LISILTLLILVGVQWNSYAAKCFLHKQLTSDKDFTQQGLVSINELELLLRKKGPNLKAAILLTPFQNITEIYSELAKLYNLIGYYDRAITYSTKAIKARLKSKVLVGAYVVYDFLHLGKSFACKGQYNLAFANFDKALGADLKYYKRIRLTESSIYFSMAMTYKKQGSTKNAIIYFKKALQVDFKFPRENRRVIVMYHTKLGQIYRSVNDKKQALYHTKKGSWLMTKYKVLDPLLKADIEVLLKQLNERRD